MGFAPMRLFRFDETTPVQEKCTDKSSPRYASPAAGINSRRLLRLLVLLVFDLLLQVFLVVPILRQCRLLV